MTAKKKHEPAPEPEVVRQPAVGVLDVPPPSNHLTVDMLFKFIQSHGAERVQLIRVTGTGRLDATINPLSLGNILLVIEVDPKSGHIV